MKKLLILILTFIAIGMFMTSCNFVDDGVRTAHQEFDPSAMLKKYEWFKDQAQMIQKCQADVTSAKNIYDSVTSQFNKMYGSDHTKWSPLTENNFQVKYNMAQQAYQATLSTCNKLIADYNAQSSKFNWASFNKNTENLPQEYKSVQ